MNEKHSLIQDIDERYHHKKVFEKKEVYYPSKNKFDMQKSDHDMIKTKVEEMCKEISDKYKIKESEAYEKLYLKVRKLFLELM